MALITSSAMQQSQILGSDLQFSINNNFIDITGIPLLLQDIQILILTLPGERVFRPDFGCNLRNQIWENIDTAAINGCSSISTAIRKYEPRVNLLSVKSSINYNTGLVVFAISFLILGTDTIQNLVFPYRTSTALSFA